MDAISILSGTSTKKLWLPQVPHSATRLHKRNHGAMSPWHVVLVALAGWLNREQQKVIEYLKEENRVLSVGESCGDTTGPYSARVRDLSRHLHVRI
jgi:hypothetical protein